MIRILEFNGRFTAAWWWWKSFRRDGIFNREKKKELEKKNPGVRRNEGKRVTNKEGREKVSSFQDLDWKLLTRKVLRNEEREKRKRNEERRIEMKERERKKKEKKKKEGKRTWRWRTNDDENEMMVREWGWEEGKEDEGWKKRKNDENERHVLGIFGHEFWSHI